MKLSIQIKASITPKLILRINELYHDYENQIYNQRHPSIFEKEQKRWTELVRNYILSEKPINCLDYGCGTGFVSKIIAPKLKEKDNLMCLDVSQEVLNICQSDIKNLNVQCNSSFIKIDGIEIPVENHSVDRITVNSVLHHILNIENFISECHRILKKDGLLIIAHEPNGTNNLPYRYKIFLWLMKNIIYPQNIFIWLAERNRAIELFLRKQLNKLSETYKARNRFLDIIADQLMKEKLIAFKLRGVEIQQLVDIQTEFGFKKVELLQKFSPSFKLLDWNTYNFIDLGFNKLSDFINARLQKKFPDSGKMLCFILQKQ